MGLTQLLLILAVLLLLFGVRRVPQLARSLGKGLGEVGRVKAEIEEGVGISQLRRAGHELVQWHDQGADNVGKCLAFSRIGGRNGAAEMRWS